MSFSLDELPEASRRKLAELLFGMLALSRFAAPARWRDACVVFTPERREVVHRQSLASELLAAGLVDAAHEVTARRVRPGEVLVYLLRDDEAGAGAAFVVIDLRAELR